MLGFFALGQQALGGTPISHTAYAVTVGTGTFTLSGQAVNLLATRKVVVGTGAFSLTGNAVNLRKSWLPLGVGTGSFTLTGNSVNLLRGYVVHASVGTFTLSGQAVIFKAARHVLVGTGAFTLTGQPVTFKAARHVLAGTGAFTLSGQPVIFKATRHLLVGTGSYTFTGNAVNLRHGFSIPVGRGSFVLTGQSARLLRGYVLHASPLPQTIAASDDTQHFLFSSLGAVALGQGATHTDAIVAARTYDVFGQDVRLIRTYLPLVAEAGAFVVTGQSVAWRIRRQRPTGRLGGSPTSGRITGRQGFSGSLGGGQKLKAS